jgi:hypothetical protein
MRQRATTISIALRSLGSRLLEAAATGPVPAPMLFGPEAPKKKGPPKRPPMPRTAGSAG